MSEPLPRTPGWTERGRSRRSSARLVEGSIHGGLDLARRLLEAGLSGIPHRLYLSEQESGLRLLHARDLPLDPGDPWTLEVSSLRLWEGTSATPPVALAKLPRPPGLPAPRSSLALWPVRRDGVLRGGLLLRAPGRGGRWSVPVLRRLREPRFHLTLELVLELHRAWQSEEDLSAFRQVVGQALPYGFLGIDCLGRVRFLGGRAEAILGLSEEEAIGRDCGRVFRPVGLEKHPLLEGLKSRSIPVEMYLAQPRGPELPISLVVARLDAGGESRRGLVAFFQDLSEQRALEEAERQKDRLASLGELSAGVAHEIRNPLTGIANCAQVLREGLPADDPRQRFLGILLDEAGRLNRIVEGLLRYARPSQPELCLTSIEDCLRRVLDLVQGQLAEKGIRVEQRTRGRVPSIFVDPSQIEQVLLNLIRNAEDAMPTGGELQVEVSVIRRRPHQQRSAGRRATDRVKFLREVPRARYVQVKIADTGNGIPKELLSRIWNPFFTTRPRGTGLGLSLSQSIMREHGGSLTVRSVEKKGTTVLLDLPIERRHGERRKSQ